MFELSLLCPQQQVEVLSEALDALAALSVSVEDADAQSDAEQALYGEPGLPPPAQGWQRSRLSALWSTQAAALEAAALLQAQDYFAGCAVLGVQRVPELDWVRLTQAQFEPVQVTPEFWVVPSWHQAPAQAQTVLRLDPGLAFGSGTHPTTHMCLRWLARQGGQRGLARVLDYGCGSGILAIAAAKLGASAVDAVDIDPTALDCTRSNAQTNEVALNVGPPELALGQYSTVLANILATPLKLLAPLLHARLAPGGTLVLSGILARQTQELCLAYAPYCELQVCDQQDGWVLLSATV